MADLTNEKIYLCKSAGFAVFLLQHGCTCLDVQLDKYNNDRLIYLFRRDERCQRARDEFFMNDEVKAYGRD